MLTRKGFWAILGLLTVLAAAGFMSARRSTLSAVGNQGSEQVLNQGLQLPLLESERSPYFSRQVLRQADGSRVEILCYRRDSSRSRLYFGTDGVLQRVETYCQAGANEMLIYEASYEKDGRRISRSCRYGLDGLPETRFERRNDGGEVYVFYRHGMLIQEVERLKDGDLRKLEHDGQKKTIRTEAQDLSRVLLFWDSAKTIPRLRIASRGGRLESFEYFRRDGKLEHRGQVIEDGGLEITYLDDAGKSKVRQVWRFLGEDWERPYYALASAEKFAFDGRTVEHKITLRSNGVLASHERFSSITGKLEMRREFDRDGRVARVEDYNESGQVQQLRVFPQSETRARGFVPDGMRSYPGADEKLGYAYRLDGKPFQHSVLDQHDWALFQVDGK